MFNSTASVCSHLQAADQLVTKAFDALRKVGGVGSLPIGAILAGNGISAGKGNVHNILGVMAVVASEVLVGEAQLAHRQRRFASGCTAVGVAPNTIVLK